ncbi:MAG: hypothetical protein CL927_06790 [Deltaproteobacteria bacterium]|nr:hypothetical protein [Deltaproteobacteria bacterium]HCH63053.1 DUF1343 domain-containing protein [Deltaproteobacteria bacterium]
MRLGIDRLAQDASLRARLSGRRLGLVCHPASVTSTQQHSLDVLDHHTGLKLSAIWGPQHGFMGDKQDNMVETDDTVDSGRGIPIFSLYGETRRPTPEMMAHVDVVLFDLQDVGTRIYTFLTTLLYLLEACAEHGKTLWVLDRPNPAGRPVEGTLLRPGYESFVGAGPLPMRHGLTLGEAAHWFVKHFRLDVDYEVIEMEGYDPTGPGHGWPSRHLPWVNPSPNAASLNMVRAYPGTVVLEGCTLSEGRGTTIPLEVMGAPDIHLPAIRSTMQRLAPEWLSGAWLRSCFFEPTFHKHVGETCQGIQVHTDLPAYRHAQFQPYRLINLFLKGVRLVHPDYPLWRDFPYEYTSGALPVDYIDGGPLLREWVDDPQASVADREALLAHEEQQWRALRAPFLCYPS